MSANQNSIDRRNFLKSAGAVGASLGLASSAMGAAQSKSSGRVLGANDRINVGVIGCGGRGTYVARQFAKAGETANAKIMAVCDV
jgi:hypothetical protein